MRVHEYVPPHPLKDFLFRNGEKVAFAAALVLSAALVAATALPDDAALAAEVAALRAQIETGSTAYDAEVSAAWRAAGYVPEPIPDGPPLPAWISARRPVPPVIIDDGTPPEPPIEIRWLPATVTLGLTELPGDIEVAFGLTPAAARAADNIQFRPDPTRSVRIERREPGGEWGALGEFTAPHADTDVVPGAAYEYRAVALGEHGTEGTPSEPVPARAGRLYEVAVQGAGGDFAFLDIRRFRPEGTLSQRRAIGQTLGCEDPECRPQFHEHRFPQGFHPGLRVEAIRMNAMLSCPREAHAEPAVVDASGSAVVTLADADGRRVLLPHGRDRRCAAHR